MKINGKIICPFCNIRMYRILDEDYPDLDKYLCYGCGFQSSTVVMEEKGLYQAFQQLFMHSNGLLVPKKLPPTKPEQPEKPTRKRTEPKAVIEFTNLP